jgi:signal transduction histidine kinase
VHLTVSDRGPGLAEDERTDVFRPLQRGRAGAGAPEGTGMGLAIARTFALAQSGDVVYAPRDGGGAHFTLILPAVDDLPDASGSGGIGF